MNRRALFSFFAALPFAVVLAPRINDRIVPAPKQTAKTPMGGAGYANPDVSVVPPKLKNLPGIGERTWISCPCLVKLDVLTIWRRGFTLPEEGPIICTPLDGGSWHTGECRQYLAWRSKIGYL